MVMLEIGNVTFYVTEEHYPWYEALNRWVESCYEDGDTDHIEYARQDFCPWEFN